MSKAQPEKLQLVLVSGLSGSGKTVALRALEDLDFYCVDNLPAALLPAFTDEMLAQRLHGGRIAVGVDARSGELSPLLNWLDSRDETAIDCLVFFITADDKVLLKRFSETRRRHPLTADRQGLSEAILAERELLAAVEQHADYRIDTSDTNIHELRGQVWKLVRRSQETPLSIVLQSFAFKRGLPQDADFLFDARCLPNPHWEPELRPMTGHDSPVRQWLSQAPMVDAYYHDIKGFMSTWLPQFEASQRSYLTIAIGCTGGQHRSVYLAERLAASLRRDGQKIAVQHREL